MITHVLSPIVRKNPRIASAQDAIRINLLLFFCSLILSLKYVIHNLVLKWIELSRSH